MVSPVIVALDFPTVDQALSLARRVAGHVGGFKVGLELIAGAGPDAITSVAELGLPVFADMKLHDIPNTVERAARRVASAGARWCTVHASGGREMIEAAVSGMGGAGILGVTVLTSLSDSDIASVGMIGNVESQVERLAALTADAGAEGAVCSPRDTATVKRVSPGLLIFTPGVRAPGDGSHDQKRVATPQAALAAGADFLVVGRSITAAADPAAAAREIAASLAVSD